MTEDSTSSTIEEPSTQASLQTSRQSTQTAFPAYSGPSLETVRSIVASQFQVKDAFLDPYGVPTFLAIAEPAKQKFKKLLENLATYNLLAAVRGATDMLTIKVFSKPHLGRSRYWINVVMFAATVATVLLAGYILRAGGLFQSDPLTVQLYNILEPGRSALYGAGLFAAGLIAIIGLHEFGHKTIAVRHKLDATYPYFIPGPPPIGTFGALISLRAPPANRDELFDLGLSGPVVGFAVTIAVALLAYVFSTPLGPISNQLNAWNNSCIAQRGVNGGCLNQAASPFDTPLILTLIDQFMNPTGSVGPEVALIVAAQIGALLTFLNIIPAWQLDGGHISRAVFGPYGHRIATILGLLLLIGANFWTFALLVIVFMAFSRRGMAGVEPLDDVSPVSNGRKILYFLGIIMLVLTFARIPLP